MRRAHVGVTTADSENSVPTTSSARRATRWSAKRDLRPEETLVADDEVDYYGKRYWLEHQRDELGLPDIYERARLDLPERCVHWLKALLRYVRPPARVLEVGAGHGAYTALLQWAGYDATALDLSPWVAEFARKHFGISYLVGPVREHELAPQSFDVVVANDVLEHLADPSEDVRSWAALLKPDGLLVVQTPEFNPERSYEMLLAEGDPFLDHMQRAGTEHLYLFSRASIRAAAFGRGLGPDEFRGARLRVRHARGGRCHTSATGGGRSP